MLKYHGILKKIWNEIIELGLIKLELQSVYYTLMTTLWRLKLKALTTSFTSEMSWPFVYDNSSGISTLSSILRASIKFISVTFQVLAHWLDFITDGYCGAVAPLAPLQGEGGAAKDTPQSTVRQGCTIVIHWGEWENINVKTQYFYISITQLLIFQIMFFYISIFAYFPRLS